MEFFDLHTLKWIQLWDKVPTIKYKVLEWYLTRYQELSIKLRWLDCHFYNIDFIKSHYQITFKLNTQFINLKELKNIANNDDALMFNYKNIYFKIYHVYKTKTHIVLYSIPDARTLIKAYQNNLKLTDYKLSSLCNDVLIRKNIMLEALYIASK